MDILITRISRVFGINISDVAEKQPAVNIPNCSIVSCWSPVVSYHFHHVRWWPTEWSFSFPQIRPLDDARRWEGHVARLAPVVSKASHVTLPTCPRLTVYNNFFSIICIRVVSLTADSFLYISLTSRTRSSSCQH